MNHEEIVAREKALEEKRMRIREIVSLASKSLSKPTPDLKFWIVNCPESKGKELVHYHSKDHTVCVSELDLRELSIEEVEDKTRGVLKK